MARLSQRSAQAVARLRAYRPPTSGYQSLPLSRRAAVLILLFADRLGDLRVVLTLRASTLKSFPGQAALPGGKADYLSESPFQTARREAFEEIGLPSDDKKLPSPFRVEHLCQLPLNLAKTELGVRPCVAFLHSDGQDGSAGVNVEESLIPRLDAKEVAAVFTAPFHNILLDHDEMAYPEEQARLGRVLPWYQGSWGTWHETPWRMHNFHVPILGQKVAKPETSTTELTETADKLQAAEKAGLSRYRVFGMTARILVDTARVAYAEEPEFEHNSHFGDEDMIAKLQKIGRLGEKSAAGEELTQDVMKKAASL